MKVCYAMSRRLCCSHCSDRPVLARAAGNSTVPTGIDQSIKTEQLDALAVRSACGRAAIGGVVWPAQSHVGAETQRRPHCWCCACACMALPCCMCFVYMLSMDTVGRGADKER